MEVTWRAGVDGAQPGLLMPGTPLVGARFVLSVTSGEDGAKPGIVMPAVAEIGMAYRQEYFLGEAEDAGRIVVLGLEVIGSNGNSTEIEQTFSTAADE